MSERRTYTPRDPEIRAILAHTKAYLEEIGVKSLDDGNPHHNRTLRFIALGVRALSGPLRTRETELEVVEAKMRKERVGRMKALWVIDLAHDIQPSWIYNRDYPL